jgi:riboflavin biosynthesis pyrimidine reductase
LTEEIAAVRDATTEDVAIGGPLLASAAIELDLVDEYRMLRVPHATGGGTPFWPPLPSGRALELVESRTIGSHTVYEAYGRPRG